MTSLAWLIPAALILGGLGLAAFLWSLKSGQYDDLEGAAWRALDDRPPQIPETSRQGGEGSEPSASEASTANSIGAKTHAPD